MQQMATSQSVTSYVWDELSDSGNDMDSLVQQGIF